MVTAIRTEALRFRKEPGQNEKLRASARCLPWRPGVYLMQNVHGSVIYVGKAVNLRRRVTSYSTPSAAKDRKVCRLVEEVESVSYIETPSELEALLVESRLIKAMLPTYNRRLTEPESCAYFRVDFSERLPRIEASPVRREDGALYLGPFWRSWFVGDAVEALEDIFCLRRCEGEVSAGSKKRACIYHELKKCSGPCSGAVSVGEYIRTVKAAWDALCNDPSETLARLVEHRDALSENLRFEEAQRVHRQMQALEHISVLRKATPMPGGAFAVMVHSYLPGRPVLLLFSHGRLVAKFLAGPKAYPDADMISERLQQLETAEEDLLPGRPSVDDLLIIRSYLHQKGLSNFLVPIRPDISPDSVADEMLSLLDSLRS